MKPSVKIILQPFRILFLLSPLLLLLTAVLLSLFALPPQYDQTYPAALQDKLALLERDASRPRIIVVGGSSVAFGQRSDLLAEQLPGYDVVNFGLYAGLGVSAMMDLSLPHLRPGDVVVLAPEQHAQPLSGYFGALTMWQACDGAPWHGAALQPVRRRAMAGQALPFAAQKLRLLLSGDKPAGDAIYARTSIHAWGDIAVAGRGENVMPGGFDPDQPILFDLPDQAFLDDMNAYAAACRARGAQICYRFCPMNAAAVSPDELRRAEAYASDLQALLDFPVLGTPERSILEPVWFFDTNFHLNDSGAILHTIRLAEDLQALLGMDASVTIPAPLPPEASAGEGDAAPLTGENELFRWEVVDQAVCITALTDEARALTVLALPDTLDGLPVEGFLPEVFAGNERIRELTLPGSIRHIRDGSLRGCTALERLVLEQAQPQRITAGSGLLDGTDCVIIVPAQAYAAYQTSYFWSPFARRIRPGASPQSTPSAAPTPRSTPAATASPHALYFDANGGLPLQGTATRVSIPLSRTHLRTNTPMGHTLFAREGFAPLCWNTRADGSGQRIPFGSRTDSLGGTILYMEWIPLTAPDTLQWVEEDGAAVVTGWTGSGDTLALPSELGGLPVARLAAGAFQQARLRTVVLPPTLRRVDRGAFIDCTLHTLWLYDSLTAISDGSLLRCKGLQTLFVHADTAPRYAVSYFAAFADKVDWLRSVASQRKLILFGGSATRYGYNSVELLEAFPAYQPVNMGVYAYTNALPQLRIIQRFVIEGDVLLSSPEFDTTETQFCPSRALDDSFWAMAEADYANAALLDLRQYTRVLTSLGTYLDNRSAMPERSWEESPRGYDDDGNVAFHDTYNQYGDYTLLRSGGGHDGILAYFRADYTVEAFPEALIESLNSVYREFRALGAEVIFAYSPRNIDSLTAESTQDSRRALHAHLQQHLEATFLLELEDSLYPGTFFYLIDSHLNDEGLYLHSKRVIQALRALGLGE